MSDTDFSLLMGPVAQHPEIWGPPNPGMSTKLSLRWGGQGSKSVDLQKGTWFDHEAGLGGGVIDLVMNVTAGDKASALEWLETEGFIEKRDSGHNGGHQRANSAPVDNEPPEREQPPEESADGVPVPVKGYRYTDGDGSTLYEVIRYHFKLPDGSFVPGKSGNPKKTFKQRRPDGKGGYVWGLGDVPHTIYRRQSVEIAISEGKTILLPEGEKDVETLEEWGLVASTNSGGAQGWTSALAAMFRDADVVILGDDDEAGRKRVETVACSLRGIAKRIRVIEGWGGAKDVTDWKEKSDGTSAKLAEIIQNLSDWHPRPPTSGMGAVGLHQLHHPSLKHDFMIEGFLDRQGVAMMPGASGSGKTFLVLEMAMCTALGLDFWGMKVKPGLVLYQAGEGKQGVTKRLDGWMIDRGIPPSSEVPFQMLTRRVNLFNDDKDADDIISEGKAWSEYYGVPVRMVVIDTFNKAITGANENAGQDMTKVIARLERISVTLDCAVVVPIHKSAEGRMRGHTSLTGDVANVINVTELDMKDRNQRIIRTVTLDKNKDGEKGRPMRFVLRQVVLDPEPDGKIVTTCVVDRPDGDEEEAARQGKLSLNQFLILRALKNAVEDHGEPAPLDIRAGPQVKAVVKYQHWVDQVRRSWVFQAPDDQPAKRDAELNRVMLHAGKVLLAGEYIGRDNDKRIVWHTGKEDRPKRERKVEAPPPKLPADVRDALNEGVPF